MKLTVNGRQTDVPEKATVRALLDLMNITNTQGVAVAVADSVVGRSDWETTKLTAGQRVEVLRAVQGGSQ